MARRFYIGGRCVGEGQEPFIIAEAGINHNGQLETAKRMICVAAEAGVDAVKFQTFRTEDFLTDRTITYSYTSQGESVTESMYDMFKRTEFSAKEWRELKACCDEVGIAFLSTPVAAADASMLVGMGVGAIKVGSDDFTNIPLILRYAEHGIPLLLSCGMSDGDEMSLTVKSVEERNGQVCLLLCTSQYPTPAEDVNALKLLTMREMFPDVVLGFSDHTQGSVAAVVATACGASVFEKHFTLDHNLPGPDHWFSSEPDELREWASSIRTAWKAMGSPELAPTAAELEMRPAMRRSIVALEPIGEGEPFTEGNVGLRRPGTGLPPVELERFLEGRAARSISANEVLAWSDWRIL